MPWNTTQEQKETICTLNILGESLENKAEQKKSISKSYILYNSTYITFLSDEILEMENRFSGCQGLGMWWRRGEGRGEVYVFIKEQHVGSLFSTCTKGVDI